MEYIIPLCAQVSGRSGLGEVVNGNAQPLSWTTFRYNQSSVVYLVTRQLKSRREDAIRPHQLVQNPKPAYTIRIGFKSLILVWYFLVLLVRLITTNARDLHVFSSYDRWYIPVQRAVRYNA